MTILQSSIVPSSGYLISRSLRFNSADSAFLNRTPASAGNRKTWTWSGWVKRTLQNDVSMFSQYTDANNQSLVGIRNNTTGTNPNTIRFYDLVSGSFTTDIYWSPVYRDVSAWYHIVFVADTTQSTNTNRIKLYVNGVQVTATISATWPAQNTDLRFNLNASHFIGQNGAGGQYADGYLTEINFIDGQALTPSSFGQSDPNTGVWSPIKYTGTYGTNGFYLNFSDNSNTTAATLGKDSSGNGNNWTPNNFSVTAGAGNDSLVDTPTSYGSDTGVGGEVRGNYATLNPLDSSTGNTFSDGNLQVTTGTSEYGLVRSTIGITSGKWYWEVVQTASGTTNNTLVGIAKSSASFSNYLGGDANGWSYAPGGNKYNNNSGSAYGATWTTNDVIGVAFDADAGTLTFYKNNVSQGTAFTGLTSGPYFPAVSDAATSFTTTAVSNFGQRPFAYTAPSGFKALCTQNLPTPTIGATSTTQAGKYFNANLYTGTGSAFTLTGVGFQPDFGWFKGRNASSSHWLHDVVRGANPGLSSNSTAAEDTTAGQLTAFASDGYSLPNDTAGYLNFSGRTMVVWSWKGGGTGVTNTSGTITSTVSANTTAGFSIVTYTGNGVNNATVGHGLGAVPSFVIVKRRDAAENWNTKHSSLSSNNVVFLNDTIAQATPGSGYVGNLTSSTVITLVNGGAAITNVNGSGATYVAYCFAAVAGYSAFGSYTGNGSTDGPFVYTGFRPRYVMFKRTNSTGNWIVEDTSRSPYNQMDAYISANASSAEATGAYYVDYLSNGFKLRYADSFGDTNANGSTYIYAAFAESPFKYALAR